MKLFFAAVVKNLSVAVDGLQYLLLLIVRDPSRVILGVSSEEFNAKTPGLQLTELVATYGGVAGTNAGGFNDENGRGNGGDPRRVHGVIDSEGHDRCGRRVRPPGLEGRR